MDDRTFELLEKMYVELQEIKQFQKKMDIKVEQNIEPKIQALFEAKDIIYEKLDNLEEEMKEVKEEVRVLSSKLEKQEVEIKVIKGGK